MVTQWIMALTSYGCGLLAPPKKKQKRGQFKGKRHRLHEICWKNGD